MTAWDSLEKKANAPVKPKPDANPEVNADPNGGLMNMMQSLYEEGDDDMKRQINEAMAKANNESRG